MQKFIFQGILKVKDYLPFPKNGLNAPVNSFLIKVPIKKPLHINFLDM